MFVCCRHIIAEVVNTETEYVAKLDMCINVRNTAQDCKIYDVYIYYCILTLCVLYVYMFVWAMVGWVGYFTFLFFLISSVLCTCISMLLN